MKSTTKYLPRPRLDNLFDQATACKLVYVVAGIGYGKTQAVHHYLTNQEDALVRWMTLSKQDNIVSRYWENLTHCLSVDNPELAIMLREFGFPDTPTHFKNLSKSALTLISKPKNYHPEDSPPENTTPEKMFLVFDDFQLIQSKEILTFMERLVHLPFSNVCIVIISRKEPELDVISLIAKGQLHVITEDDLRFTASEAAAFFQQRGMPLSFADISQLMSATKGWVLALNMLSFLPKKKPRGFKQDLHVVMDNIFHFIEKEAWENFSEAIQKSLVKLSLLADLPMESAFLLADKEVLGENVPELTTFIWIDRYSKELKIHSLYLDFLKSKQDLLSHNEKMEIYRHAARWCVEHDFFLGSIYYHAQAQQFDAIVKTFLSYPLKLSKDASEYLLSIFEKAITDAAKQEHVSADATKQDSIDTDNAKQGKASTGALKQEYVSVLLVENYFLPLLFVGTGKYEEAKQRSMATIDKWKDENSSLAHLLLYTTYTNLAYIDMYICTASHAYDAPRYLEKSISYFKQLSLPFSEASGAFINADLRSFACLVGEGANFAEFEQFREAAEQIESSIQETSHGMFAGYSDLVACEIAFFSNQPGLARNHAHNAILKAGEMQQYSIVFMAENYLLRVAVLEGNASLVKDILKTMAAHLKNPSFWNRQLYYDLYTTGFYAQLGLLEEIPQWFTLDDTEIAFEIHLPAKELYLRALYYIARKQYSHALTLLCDSFPRERSERFFFGELKFLLLLAVARLHTGDVSGAISDFEKAYELSFQGFFEIFFLELGKELQPLVAATLKRNTSSIPLKWLKTIARKGSIYTKKMTIVANAFPSRIEKIIELSPREKEVLLDLYHGLSREEIAENQYLSINTIKKVLQSIYLKLDANNSIDAIRIALDKGIIS